MHEKVSNSFSPANAIDKDMLNTQQRIDLFNNIYNWLSSGGPEQKWLFCEMTYSVISQLQNTNTYQFSGITYYLNQLNVNINKWLRPIDAYWGVFNTLSGASIFNDKEAVNNILETVNDVRNKRPATI